MHYQTKKQQQLQKFLSMKLFVDLGYPLKSVLTKVRECTIQRNVAYWVYLRPE